MANNNNYSELLKHPKWQKKRLQILNRDKFTCVKCKDKETTLHVHHKEYIKGNKPWEYKNKTLVTLCEDCHKIVGASKESYLDKFDFDKVKVCKIIDNYNKIIFYNDNYQLIIRVFNNDNELKYLGVFYDEILDIFKILKSFYL